MTDKKAVVRNYYADIFHSPHWEPSSRTPSGLLSHPRMSIDKRAAMFASFDALAGYKEAVTETARRTDERTELSESELEELNRQLKLLIDRMEKMAENRKQPGSAVCPDETSVLTVSITYFLPDAAKDGGSYVTVTGAIRKIDSCQRLIFLEDGTLIRIDDVVKLDSGIFSEYSFNNYK